MTVQTSPGRVTPTALMRHVAFFDANHDGRIHFGEMYSQGRKLGMSPVSAALFSATTLVTRGPATSGRFWVIDVGQVERSIFDEASGMLDPRGETSPERIDAFFSAYDLDADGYLTQSEVKAWLAEEHPGAFARLKASAGWNLLFGLLGTDAGAAEPRLSRAQLQGLLYDGTLFDALAERHALQAKQR